MKKAGAVVLLAAMLPISAQEKKAEKCVIRPTMSATGDTEESPEVNAFMNRLAFKCPAGMVVVDAKHLMHPNMSYKDTINALGQLECRRDKPKT